MLAAVLEMTILSSFRETGPPFGVEDKDLEGVLTGFGEA
jgi:hypothetical protein